MSLLRYLKKGSGSVLPSPGGSLSRHMPSSSIASANKEVKSVLECRSHKPRSQTSSLLSVDRKREVSKLNVGVVLIIAIREISNHENEFDVNSRNIRPSKITRYTVSVSKEVFNLIFGAKMAAVGMNAKFYSHSQALNGDFFHGNL